MAGQFHRNQNASERVQRLNDLGDAVDNHELRLTAIESGAPLPPPDATTADDPGDLTVYYENGKA